MEYVWVACSMREFGSHVGDKRHLIRKISPGRYMLDTICGHSASVEGIWRRNSTKPKCPTCEEWEGKNL